MPNPPPDPSLCLTLTLFGCLSVRCTDWAVDELPPQQKASLLAYLTLAGYRATPRQELIALLWPESAPEKASQNLRQCLHSLRLLLEQPPFASGSVLWANRTEVRLNPDVIRTDVIAFEGAIETAKRTMDRRERIASLAHAADLYRGELLPGFYQDRIVSERHRLTEVHQQALHLLVREMEAEGDLDRALHYAHRTALLAPQCESACCALMRVYATMGEPSAVLRTYQEWEARHIKEFGEPPHEVSREIAQQWQHAARQQTALRQEPIHAAVVTLCPDTEGESTAAAQEITAPVSSTTPAADRATPELRPAPVANRNRYFPVFVAGIGLSVILLACFARIGSRSGPNTGNATIARSVHSPEPPSRKAAVALATIDYAAPKLTRERGGTPDLHGGPSPVRITSTSSKQRPLPANTPKRPGRTGDTRDFPASRSKPFGPQSAPNMAPTPLARPIGADSLPEAAPGGALWARHYPLKPGDKDDQPTAMTTDSAANIYITGFVNTFKTDVDYQTLKYSPEGKLLWEARYDGPGHDLDRAKAIAVDSAGNVYVTGESDGGKGSGPERLNSLDIATAKYSPDGKQVWVKRYDGPGHGMDSGTQIGVDSADNVYVFGQSWGGESSNKGGVDLVLLKYARDGTLQWEQRYPTYDRSETAARAMILDRAGGIYVTAAVHKVPESGVVSTEPEVLTLKYDEKGKLVWQQRYTGPAHQKDEPTCIALDRRNNVFVVGFTRTGFTGDIPKEGYLVLKYNPQGALVWERDHSWAGYIDRPWAAAVDSRGRIYITGEVQLSPGEATAFGTLLYDDNGKIVWADPYYGSSVHPTRAMGTTIGRALALNSVGECYVTGSTWYMNPRLPNLAPFDRREYATFRYDADGARSRPMRYRGRDYISGGQGPNCIAVDENDNVIVTGQSTHDNVVSTVTVKYHP